MMISPEEYYEKYLKGKTEDQIMRAIRGLKREMGRLKNIMERPGYGQQQIINPGEDARIRCVREYLDIAKQAYVEAGGVYTLSKSEKMAADFDSNIDFISKITFSIGGFFGGYRRYVVELSDEISANTKLGDDEEPLVLFDNDNRELFTKATFVAALVDLHVGEWRRSYSTQRFGYVVCDGTQWELEVEFSNGHKAVRFSGDNSYPYNFNKFKMLFGIEDEEETDYE